MRGLTELKLHELISHMETYSIDILCIQETWCKQADVYTEQEYLVILSGTTGNERCWSGVGFIVSPSFRHRVRSYKQVDDRIAYLKLNVAGGVVGIFSAYAPHNGKPLPERFNFYATLDEEYRKCSVNMGKYLFGDFNARLG